MPVVRVSDAAEARGFYVDMLGFRVGMEQDGMLMLVSPSVPTTQLIVAWPSETAFDPDVLELDMTVEVADVDFLYAEAKARGLEIVRELRDEPWGIRRFFVRDPGGRIINVNTHVVVLETERLVLRRLRPDDFDALFEVVWSDPEVTWDHQARTPEEAREALQHRLHHQREHGFGMMPVLADGEILGWAGLQHLEDGPEIELGYYLGRLAWGQGYGSELARALVAWGFESLGLDEIVAVVRPENDASKRVLSNAGLAFQREGHHYGFDVERWAVTRPPSTDRR